MNVLLISQCSGRALTETRRILDQFAERRGDRTWQTPITQQGLDTLRRLLRKTARRNTAVACHWIRGRDYSELIWIVGNASRFNAEGAVPTNTTQRDILRSQDENDWHTAEDIRLLAKLAGLFHDLGKSNDAFQRKLKPTGKRGKPVRDAYRHEWVSLRLFEAFVGGDDDATWLARLANIRPEVKPLWLNSLARDGCDNVEILNPFKSLTGGLAQIVGWLILSHHFLPVNAVAQNTQQLKRLPGCINSDWNRADAKASKEAIKACWEFKKGLPFASKSWCYGVARLAQRMQQRTGLIGKAWIEDPFVSHLSRLCLMLADHHYSSLPADPSRGDAGCNLYANTDANGQRKQRLDEHLLGVGSYAGQVARVLPQLAQELPRIARHRGFSVREKKPQFQWQNKAFDLAITQRQQALEHGFFGVNMASTGCGKTLANGRIMYGLADPVLGARFNIALGLRTLTLQTGQAYRERLKLGPDVLAVRVGGGAAKTLYEHNQDQQVDADSTFAQQGSESAEALMDATDYVHFEGSLGSGPFKKWFESSPDAQRLLSAPILVSTIDHLIPATEGVRGGRQIIPMLRLMSADLVLDEPDDFDLGDLPALTRLVHWAAMLGSRVLLSSATLPPAMLQGLFNAYIEGRKAYQQNRGNQGFVSNVCCAWFDEHNATASQHATADSFSKAHQVFVEKRLKKLKGQKIRRRAIIYPVAIASGQDQKRIRHHWAANLYQPLQTLHAHHHSIDPVSQKRVSFGLVRMAHIDALIDTALALYSCEPPPGQRWHLCSYHSRYPLLQRSAIEKRLDKCLNRKLPDKVFEDKELRALLDSSDETDQIFIVLATPVAEVGRDHDYDWAIVEPSSMRSIIQLAGRIMRHRDQACEAPNLYLLDTNLDSLEKPGQPAYCKPGFESKEWRLSSHRLSELLNDEQWARIDAAPRILERAKLQPADNLVDLEHARLRALMLDENSSEPFPTTLWWHSLAHTSATLQRVQPFRKDTGERQRYLFLPDEDARQVLYKRLERNGLITDQDKQFKKLMLPDNPRIQPWGETDYLAQLEALATELDMEIADCAMRFGYVDLEERTQGWRYHPALGIRRYL